jgi:hypothetical protein
VLNKRIAILRKQINGAAEPDYLYCIKPLYVSGLTTFMATQPIIERENSSVKVSLKDKLIRWRTASGGLVSIDLEKVAVIGEYTKDRGPFVDDWFLVFVYKSGEWKEVSVYANGFQELAQHLCQLFRFDFSKPFLANSTGWKSIVRYPQIIEGKELFVFTPPKGYKPPTSFVQNMKAVLGLGVYGQRWRVDLTEEMKAEVASASR